MLKIVSFFSGAGGLDLGFQQAKTKIIWANEYDSSIFPTYIKNLGNHLVTKSIVDIDPDEVPDCDGIIGGPPCQSWSQAGAGRGINDSRGQLFLNYVNIIKAKKPKFFLAENVQGLINSRNISSMNNIFTPLTDIGYNVSFKLLDANNYGVPQNRKRVIIVGYPSSYNKFFFPPSPNKKKLVLSDAILKFNNSAVPSIGKDHHNSKVIFPNHEYIKGRKFSSHYMSRNRVRSWNQPSYTIQAGGRHAPCHPQAPKMIKTKIKDVYKFKRGETRSYRRLTVRECAAIQTFPDDFIFEYKRLNDGYKMVGNAVPVEFARHLALQVKKDLKEFKDEPDFTKKGSLMNLNKPQMELSF